MDTVSEIILYVLDAIILVQLIRMKIASNKIEIKTKMGPRWVIPSVFWAIALVGWFNYDGMFRIVQTAALVVMGIIYFTMDSGLSPDGIVMIGRLYKYDTLKIIQVDDQKCVVNFAKNGAPAPIAFREDQMRDVRNYLVKYAGIAKHNVRTRVRDTRKH